MTKLNLNDLIARFPYDARARAKLVAFRESDLFRDEYGKLPGVDSEIEWLMFSAIDGQVAADPVDWSEAACEAAGYDILDRTMLNRSASIPDHTWAALKKLWTKARARRSGDRNEDDLTAEIIWNAREKQINQLPYAPSLNELRQTVSANDLVQVIDVLQAMGRTHTRDIFSKKALDTYSASGRMTGARFKGLVAKYGNLLAAAVGKNRADYHAGEQVKSGRGAFGRLGGSGLRSRYNAASVFFK